MAGLMLPELERVPRLNLATTPTPLMETPRLAAALGLDRLLVKRDDNTGLALGGNKARKLEYLVAAATRAGADLLLTVGAPQSNHCRCTAAAARAAGMDAHFVFNGPPVEEVQGNLLLDRLLGATWSFSPDRPASERMAELAEELRAAGPRPYGMPAALSVRALETAARTDGRILDPVCPAKALGGLMGEIEAGRVKRDDTVVFVHTGGTPALFADPALYWHPD